ncbi:MAG: response regulator [Verrucomicrobia bacterium]|nr:response regulator [Verrucomicrobiota bacterium]
MSTKILCVDDDENVLTGLQRTLRKQFQIDVAIGGSAGLQKLQQDGPYAVVMADMQMPEMNGIEFLKQAETRCPDTVRVMLTGNADQKTAVEAVNHGHVFRFLNKPCEPDSLATTLQAALRQHQLVTAERELLENTLNGSVKLLTDILATMDPDSFGRAQKLRENMKTFLQGRQATQSWDLELAAMLSPIGYVTIPPALLTKTRAGIGLSGPEKDMLARVPETGANLLDNIPRLETVAKIVRYQNKNFDGTGFPADAIAGEKIPIGARILKVLIDLEALTARQVPQNEAFAKMKSCSSRYDPKTLEAVAAAFDLYCPPTPVEYASKPVAARDLQVGDILQADIQTRDGSLILAAGNKISPMILQKIRNFAQLTGLKEPIHILTL